MTDEQLIFGAGAAADDARAACKELWQRETPQTAEGIAAVRAAVLRLKAAATQLNCAATELNNRANGMKPPKVG